jgi:hypothetical protein
LRREVLEREVAEEQRTMKFRVRQYRHSSRFEQANLRGAGPDDRLKTITCLQDTNNNELQLGNTRAMKPRRPSAESRMNEEGQGIEDERNACAWRKSV